jgi:Rieske 2Fe-2S family protein
MAAELQWLDSHDRARQRAQFAADLARTAAPFREARTLPAAAYTSADVLALEYAAVFGKDWLCVGRAADIPKPGDYFLKDIGPDSIIILRDTDGSIRAHCNVCRHRGSRLLDAPSGHGLARILCPYHAWTYHLDGTLQGAPGMGLDFCKVKFSLNPVRLSQHEGFLFITLDPNAVPLQQYFAQLPDMRRFHMPDLVCGKRIEYVVDANWKLIAENYSECYHCAGAHPQLFKISDLIARNDRSQEIGNCFNGGPMKLRDGIETMSMSGKSTLPTIPGLSHDDCRYVHYYVIYPNFLLSPHPDYVLTHTAWPISPGKTRIVCEWLFTKEAVADPKFDPSDVVEFWDVTNKQDWVLCERTQLGAQSRGFSPGPYQSTEDCVHTFDKWYANRLAPLLT